MKKTLTIVGKIPTKKGGYVYHCYEETEAYGIITHTFYTTDNLSIGQTAETFTINFKTYYIKPTKS